MHVELIGCTSAGKSTLARDIVEAGRQQGTGVVLGTEFVLRQVRLNWLKGHLPRTLAVDLAALFFCLVTWRSHHKFYLFATRLLFQLPLAPFERLNLLRNVLKKIGIYEIIRCRGHEQQVILVDEGVLQAAHNLFVHVTAEVKPEDLATFVRLIPLPDVVVYLRQPAFLLIDRTITRGHQRIPECSPLFVARFITQALATFEKLVQHPAVETRLLVVDGGREVVAAAACPDEPLFSLVSRLVHLGLSKPLVRSDGSANR